MGRPPTSPKRSRPPPVVRYTWRMHFPAAALAGAVFGLTELASFVAKRSLAAPDWVVPVIVVAAQVPWLLAPAWEVVFARIEPRRVFLWLGGLSYVPLGLIAFVTPVHGAAGFGFDLVLFLVVIANCYLMQGAFLPHRGALLRANYPEWVRGRMYARGEIVASLAMLLAVRLGGALLNLDAHWLRVLFPLAGLMGLVSALLLGRIRWRRDGQRRPPPGPGLGAIGRALRDAWAEAGRILRRDPSFRTFEVAFMLYGFGLLSSMPLVVLLGEGPLGLSYGEWADARGVAMPLAFIFGLSVVGRLTDRLGPVLVGAASFGLLALFFVTVAFAESAGHLVVAFGVFGLAMSGVTTVWALGPLHFAPPGRARSYAGVHVSLVGARSAVAPLLGYALAEAFSLDVAFVASAVMIAAGALTLAWLARRRPPSRSGARAA